MSTKTPDGHDGFTGVFRQPAQQTAFEQLYDNYAAVVYGEIVRVVGAGEPADQLMIKTFLAIAEQMHNIQHARQRPVLQLMAITRKIISDRDPDAHSRQPVTIPEDSLFN